MKNASIGDYKSNHNQEVALLPLERMRLLAIINQTTTGAMKPFGKANASIGDYKSNHNIGFVNV